MSVGEHCKFKVDKDAKQWVQIHLKRDHNECTVRLSMDGCVKQSLSEFQHEAPSTPHHALSCCVPIQHGTKVWFAKIDETAPLAKDKITFVQKVVGESLCHA